MDLDYLCQRHQASLLMAEHAASEAARRIHCELAAAYASRIAAAMNRRPIARAQ